MLELERYLPTSLIKQHHQTENYFQLTNGSIIFYGGLGDSGAVDRLKSMTLGWWGLDQAEETSESHFNMLQGRLRIILPGIHYKGLLTANPAPGWVKNLFIEQKKDDFIFIPALPRDNPYLPKDYEAKLRKSYPPELVKSLLDGDWDALEGGNFLFRYAEIRRAVNAEVKLDGTEIKTMGVDAAREGDDSSVAVVRQGNRVIHLEDWAKTDLMETTGKILRIKDKFDIKPENINLDAVALGAGIYDRLKEQKVYVNAIVAGGEPNDKEHYINSRAEMYDNLRARFEAGTISIPDDMDLIAQLSSIRFKIASDRKLQIVSKEDMKRVYRLKSPDKADALALCFYEPQQKDPTIRWL